VDEITGTEVFVYNPNTNSFDSKYYWSGVKEKAIELINKDLLYEREDGGINNF
jgi:hypothetical protein